MNLKLRTLFGIIVTALVFVACVSAQTLPRAAGTVGGIRLLGDVTVGGGSNGYNPDIDFGVAVEKPIGRRFEIQSNYEFSPLTKSGYTGHTWQTTTTALVWLRPHVGIMGGYEISHVTFGSTNKTPTFFQAGAVFRITWFGGAGRICAFYEQEIGGCTWAIATNPCTITASRFHGAGFTQEVYVRQHLRVALNVKIGRIGEQVNPFAPQAGQSHGIDGEAAIVFRFSLGRIDGVY